MLEHKFGLSPNQLPLLDQALQSLPVSLRETIHTVHNQVQSPLSLITTSLLSTLSSAVQGHVDVHSIYGRIQPVALYTLVVADSGERKSSTDRILAAPLLDFEKKALAAHADQAAEQRVEQRIFKAKGRALESKLATAIRNDDDIAAANIEAELTAHYAQGPRNPVYDPRSILNDVTPAALFQALSGQGQAVTLTSSDAGNLFGRANIDFVSNVNRIWDGEDVIISRKSGDQVIYNPRLTIAAMIQPGVLKRISMRKDDQLRLSGYLSRMLVTNPYSTQGFRIGIQGAIQKPENLIKFHERVERLLYESMHHQAHRSRITLDFSAEATNMLHKFQGYVESGLRSTGVLNDVRDAGSKITDNVVRIAALMHAFEHGTTVEKIDANIAHAACLLGEYYLSEFKHLFGEKTVAETAQEYGRLLMDWLQRNNHNAYGTLVPLTQIMQYGPNRLRKKADLLLAVQWLVNAGAIQCFQYSKSQVIQVIGTLNLV